MWSFDQLPAFGRSFVSAGRLVSALRFVSIWVVLPLGWLLLCLVVSPGEVCAVLTPRSLLFFLAVTLEFGSSADVGVVGADVLF